MLHAAGAFGVSPSAVSRKLVDLIATTLKVFPQRSRADFTPFAVFLDTIHRGGEAFLVALGVDLRGGEEDLRGEKRAWGFGPGSSEHHEICEALFTEWERRGLARSKRILFVPDGGSGLIKALRARFGQKLVPHRGAIHDSRNLQRHVAKPDRKAAPTRLMTGPGADARCRRQTDAAGVGGGGAGHERVGGGFAPGRRRRMTDAASTDGAGAAAQDAPVDHPDREPVLLGAAP